MLHKWSTETEDGKKAIPPFLVARKSAKLLPTNRFIILVREHFQCIGVFRISALCACICSPLGIASFSCTSKYTTLIEIRKKNRTFFKYMVKLDTKFHKKYNWNFKFSLWFADFVRDINWKRTLVRQFYLTFRSFELKIAVM